MSKFRGRVIVCLVSIAPVCSQAGGVLPASYDVVWTSQSANSSESMPCGGGSIGLNVWVEKNELMMYISKCDAFDENNGLQKAGRVRLRFDPDPFEGSQFSQELSLQDGDVTIVAAKEGSRAEIRVWVDVFRPVVHVDVESTIPLTTTAIYESWRTETFKERPGENFQNSYKWAPFDTIYTYKDSVAFHGNSVLFFHRNRDCSVFDANVHLQGLDSVKSRLFNPLRDLTYGGEMQGGDMVAGGTHRGRYVDTGFRGWSIRSRRPTRRQDVEIFLFTKQVQSVEEWKNGLEKLKAEAASREKTAHQQSMAWWHQFWDRSYICIDPDRAAPDSPQWQVGRNYQLFRYMLGCNAYGTSPTKFNGGLFTYDPVFVDTATPFTADYRNWCGGTMTAQNQRLVYFPMIKSGDVDMMKPQFDFYLKALGNAEIRTAQAWGHRGAGFTEQIENYGLINPAEYGWKRPEGFDKGMEYNAWLEYLWDTSLEFCFMILETQRYDGSDITGYIPLIESCLTFYREHYQYLARKRGYAALDGNGKLILYPSSGCETFKMAYNSTSTITGLRTVLEHLLALPENYLSPEARQSWNNMLGMIPSISYAQYEGHVTIAPAQAYARIQNQESPQLYPVFPWDMYGVGKPGLDTAINTWNYDPLVRKFRSHVGWKQDNIWAARLGLTEEAADLCVRKLRDSGRRFPAFWGPGFDWAPDHNWGGSGAIGLQEMLMQTTDDRIFLLPAWPKEWDVEFKLHAPHRTVVEAKVKHGNIVSLSVVPESRRKDVVVNPAFGK